MQGIGQLPNHCAQLMLGFFLVAIAMSIIRDVLPAKWARFVPIPMAMAIPFYIGANVAIDICIGALVKAYWHWTSPASAEGKVRPATPSSCCLACVCAAKACQKCAACPQLWCVIPDSCEARMRMWDLDSLCHLMLPAA